MSQADAGMWVKLKSGGGACADAGQGSGQSDARISDECTRYDESKKEAKERQSVSSTQGIEE